MEKRLFLLLLILPPLSIFSQQRYDVTMPLDGVQREFIIVKPSGATPVGGYPVVFMFHGSSGTGEEFYNNSKWRERGEIDKFITVFPTALKYCALNWQTNAPNNVTKWNNGNLHEDACPNVPQTFKDDVRFVRKMVDTIKATFTVNPKKIFAAGFSSGGGMVNKLAMDAADVFAATASSGSMLNKLDSVRPSRKIPILNTVGTLDDRFTTSAGIPELPFGGDSILGYLRGGIIRVLDCEGLTQTYTKSNTARTNSFIFTTPKPGQAPSTYIFSLVKDMHHVWPNGTNYPLVGADIFWAFFNQYTTTATHETYLPETRVAVYPNPAQSEMILDLAEFTEGGVSRLFVFNLLGQQVSQSEIQQAEQVVLKKADIGKGLFLLKIQQGQKVVTKRIVFE